MGLALTKEQFEQKVAVIPATIRDIRVGKTYRDVTGLEA